MPGRDSTHSSTVHDRFDKEKLWGVYIGIVMSNVDTTNAYRVQVSLPHIPGGGVNDKEKHTTAWARISSFLAGEYVGDSNEFGPRGAYFMPEMGDEVLVMFIYGEISHPVIVGRLWSCVAPDNNQEGSDGGGHTDVANDGGKPNHPVYAHTNKKGKLTNCVDDDPDGSPHVHNKTKHEKNKNDLSGLRTRSGHLLVFNDNKDESAIYLRSSKKHRIELVDGGNKGILVADPDDNYIWLKSGSSSGDIEVKTKGNIKMFAEKNIEMTATEDIKLKARNINTEASSLTKMKTETLTVDMSSGTMTSSGSLSIHGSPINLN